MAHDTRLAAGAGFGEQAARRAPWGALLLFVVAAFMDLLDGTIVQVALPSIQRDLHVSDAGLQWTVSAYTLAFSLLLITGSRLGDRIGRKRTFLLGLRGFVAASALVAAAQDPGMLIGFRALQGAAAALMLPQVLTFIQTEFDPEPRRAAFAVYGMMLALAGASGPLLGGVLVQANVAGWGWRTIFLVNIPLGVTALVLGSRVIPASPPNRDSRLDPAGTLLITLALLAVFYPLIEGRQLGWPAWSFVCIGAFVPLLAAFAIIELRSRQPLIDFSLFRRRGPAIGLGIALVFFGTTSFFFLLTLFLQLGLGYSALRTGVTFVPFSLGIIMGSGGAAPLGKKYGRHAVTAGAFLMTLAIVSMAVIARAAMPGWYLAPSLAVAGVAFGVVSGTLADIVLGQLPASKAASASGVVNTVIQLGSVAAIAVIGVLFFGALGQHPAMMTYVHATRVGLWYLAGCCAAASLGSLMLPASRAAS
jgi:EmrB/QacA subfamily drug resistance transporter